MVTELHWSFQDPGAYSEVLEGWVEDLYSTLPKGLVNPIKGNIKVRAVLLAHISWISQRLDTPEGAEPGAARSVDLPAGFLDRGSGKEMVVASPNADDEEEEAQVEKGALAVHDPPNEHAEKKEEEEEGTQKRAASEKGGSQKAQKNWRCWK
ncbi:hypothetical protein CYMTET_29226 [Cymbomonas tetramitiformis]|uniref:Uncharacterized protein n=1 Tax=Cymbomonas tetramitiformis TaxID=36881 RepID=A0AAE0KVE7_9CHLO|nr:hypothetical protein CYMTET_29226 [Cymbomonas tetramitiformis]